MKKTTTIALFAIFPLLAQAQQTVGLFLNDSLSYNGYTLFAPSTYRITYLIDNCGEIVNTWESEYSPGMSVYLLENGNLLRTARLNGAFTGGGVGGRIELFDWEGNLLWAYNYATNAHQQHHDIEPLPNGNILVLAWELVPQANAVAAGRKPTSIPQAGIWSEHIVELEPFGTDGANIVWEWHVWDHLVQDFDSGKNNFGVVNQHPELINLNYTGITAGGPGGGSAQTDWLHCNSIDFNPEMNQIMLSSRVFSEIWVIDHSTTTAEAASHTGGAYSRGGDLLYRWGNPAAYNRGEAGDQQFFGQHDAHWIPPGRPDAGKVMVFNNGLGRPDGDFSTVDIIEPPLAPNGYYLLVGASPFGPEMPFWSYGAGAGEFFFSGNTSGAQRLPNGNTLVCTGADGHFFEINALDDLLVWDYINPVRAFGPLAQGQVPANNGVFRADRYPVDYAGFAGKDLTPTVPVEVNPLPSNCQIFNTATATHPQRFETGIVSIYPNPATDQFFIENESGEALSIRVVDVAGRIVFFTNSTEKMIHCNAEIWNKGMYFAYLANPSGDRFFVQKIIKL
ncbi:MAG: aryl-sulfate sulfotransferase [Saprospiraceae bacterium]